MLTRNSISLGRSIQYSKTIISYGFLSKISLYEAFISVKIKTNGFGDQDSISKILRDNHNSPLKFLDEVETRISGKKCWIVCAIIMRHDVFPTLQLIHIM